MPMQPFFFAAEGPWEEVQEGIERRVAHLGGMTAALMRLRKGVVSDAQHWHPQEQAACVIEGRVRMTIDGAVRELGPGDGYLVAPNLKHHIEALEDTLLIDAFAPKREDLAATGE